MLFAIESHPAADFWDAYTDLWSACKTKSPFQSPSYLKSLSGLFKGKLAAFKMEKKGQLMGAVLLRKEETQVYHLLSDIKSDHNYFIFRDECTDTEIRDFYFQLFRKFKQLGGGLFLKNIPSWTRDSGAMLQEIKNCHLPHFVSTEKVCLVLKVEKPDQVKEFFYRSKEIRDRERKIIRQLDPVFESFVGEEDLEDWLNGYFNSHIRRWESTETPSKYQDEEQRDVLRNAMLAWIKDQVVVRFSIRVGSHRIAYAIGLIRNKTLIHHTTSYDTDYKKYSPGKVLLITMATWMENNGFLNLDFGEGGESYKYELTNNSLTLYNIHVSTPGKIGFVWKAKLYSLAKNTLHQMGLSDHTKKMLSFLRLSI